MKPSGKTPSIIPSECIKSFPYFAQFSFVLPVLQLWLCTFLYYIIKCTAKPIEFHPISNVYLSIVILLVLNFYIPYHIPIEALILYYKDIFHYETIVLYQGYMHLLSYPKLYTFPCKIFLQQFFEVSLKRHLLLWSFSPN